MRERRVHHWFGPVIDSDPALARRILKRIEREGALRSDDFLDPRAPKRGGMWNWKPEKRMLDALWTAGKLAIAGRDGFVRRYDLPERVIPARYLDAPTPTADETVRALARRAVLARGALTERGVAEHYRLQGERVRLRRALARLVRDGELRPLAVDDGGAPVYVAGEARVADAPEPQAAVFLSPFESLLWDRPFAKRVFGFDHLIEVYKPAPQRRFGYYVLPLLAGDRFFGRADLKSDRERGLVRVARFHREPRVPAREAREALDEAAARLARALDLAVA